MLCFDVPLISEKSSIFNLPLLLIFQLAILLLGAACVLCGNYGRRETEARAKAEDKLGHVSRVYEGYGGYERSRRSPLVGAPIGCTYEGSKFHLVFRYKTAKSKMATRGPKNDRGGFERGVPPGFWALLSTSVKKKKF